MSAHCPLYFVFFFICLFCNVTNGKKKLGPSFSGFSSSQSHSCELLMYNKIKMVPRYFLTAYTIYSITFRGLHDHEETGKTDAFLKLNLNLSFNFPFFSFKNSSILLMMSLSWTKRTNFVTRYLLPFHLYVCLSQYIKTSKHFIDASFPCMEHTKRHWS